ncbi:preprotein translocase subunit SecY [bacterium]|nr:preprotein translocase subunit SecY [bacterium]
MDSNLRSRLFWMFGLILVYKIGVHIPTPGIDGQALSEFFQQRASGTVFGLLNLFSGGALEQLSLLGLGIAPYISASIIMQLATVMSPKIEKLQKEGEQGRRQITQITRYMTVGIALVQGFFITQSIQTLTSPISGIPVVAEGGISFTAMTVILLSAGAVFTMWLGEQITERGIGNGSSLIIFVGIASSLFAGVGSLQLSLENETISIGQGLFLLAIMVGVIAFIVFFEQGQRRVPIQYARRMVGRKVYGGQDTHLPLKINSAGVIPPIFASTLILFPATVLSFFGAEWAAKAQEWFVPSGYGYNIVFVTGIVFFCFFYTAVSTNPNELADNLKKSGGYVPGIRPGKHTSNFFNSIITRLTFSGAIYLSLVCILPTILIATFNVNFYFGGTTLLILVGVALDTMSQLQAHLINQNYDSFLKEARLRGRRA